MTSNSPLRLPRLWLPRVQLVLCFVLLASLPLQAIALTIDNGGSNTIDTAVAEGVVINNSPGGMGTVVNVVVGGVVAGDMDVNGNSTLSLNGGTLNNVNARGSSTIILNAGETGLVALTGFAVGIMNGAVIDVGLLAGGNSSVDIFGGTLATSSSQFLLRASENATITIYGTGFNFPLGDLVGAGVLTGTLSDGTELVNVVFQQFGNGTITLVPEPSTGALLAAALVALASARRWR